MDAYMGLVMPFAFPWAPQGFAACTGTQLSISQYSALYALIGTYFGGNGTTNFNLPDLRSRVPVGIGQGTGLSNWDIGQAAGAERASLGSANLPAHTHTLAASNTAADQLAQAPANGWTLGAAASVSGARPPVTTPVQMYNAAALTPQNSVQSAQTSVAGSGSPTPVATIPPALALNFCICTMGIFPARN